MKTNTLDFDAQALRERILDLAMRGKLVPQDPNDEPASELVKNNDLKSSDEKPHDIPDSWEWIVLGSGVKFINGRAYKKSELLEDSSLTPVLRVGNLFTNSSWYYSNLNLDPNKYIDNRDLIYAWSASFGPKIWDGGHVIYHYHIWKLILDQAINKNYLYYFLLDKRNVIGETDLHGSTMKHITKTNMEHLSFPLPPFLEQSRIAAKIAQLFALLRKVESSTQQYAELQTLLKSKVLDLAMRGKLVKQDPNDEPASVLLEEIKTEKAELVKEKKSKKSKPLPPITDEEKPFDIPDSWEWVRLGAIFDITSSKRVMKSEWRNEGVPFYRAREIVSIKNHRALKDPIFISEETYKEKAEVSGRPKIDDILLTGVGTLGVPYVVSDNKEFYFKDGNIIWLRNIGKINSYYISNYIQSPYMTKIINNGRGTTVATLTIVRARNLLVPLPPLMEQTRIVNKINKLYKLI